MERLSREASAENSGAGFPMPMRGTGSGCPSAVPACKRTATATAIRGASLHTSVSPKSPGTRRYSTESWVRVELPESGGT